MDVEALFAAAVAIADAAQRRAFLDEACGGDAALRQRLERLLALDGGACGILDRGENAAAVLGAYRPQPPMEAERLFADRFRLRERLGEGGMGEVWVADQLEPVRRRVALKVVRPGLGSARLLARFEQERQALAAMDHPNIGKVHDAGVADGRPYFVMELIEGSPITRYCDDHKLTLRERLGLFVPVCAAVQHAHQKGVIHRDLKPPNILVTRYDGSPVPKVIDFGVAKATGPLAPGPGASTEVGTLVGTLEYMSPEQAEANDLDLDTRSDVYALGVVLYELLTGGVPFPREKLQALPLSEMLRLIREAEPPPPSYRLAASEALPAVAAARRTVPRRLAALVRGELDWVVMKCLEKDRSRRYGTADGLAQDLKRYLADEPVEASPPSTAYRLKKFLRRHRGPVLAVATVFLLLVGGIAGTTVGLKLASERLAQVESEKERGDEEAAIARAVDDFVQKDLLGQADVGNQPSDARDRNITVRELLDRAAAGIGTRFQGRERTEAAIRLTIGRAYRALGEYPKAQEHLERSLALREEKLGGTHPDTLVSMEYLAGLYQDVREYDKAQRLYQKVLDARRADLGAEHPHTLQTVNDIGLLYQERGWYDKAEPLLKGALEARQATLGADHLGTLESTYNLARHYRDRRHFHLAEPLYKQARDGRRTQLGPDHPHTLETMQALASLYINWGRYDEAEALFDQVVAAQRAKLGPDHHHTLLTMGELALVYQMQRRFDKAEGVYMQVLTGYHAKLDPGHPDLLRSMQNLAYCYQMGEKYDKAEPLFEEVLAAQRRKPGAGHPETIVTMTNLAILYRDRGRYGKAEPLFREAVAEARKTLGLGHEDTQTVINHLAILHSKQGKPALSEPLLRELVSFLRGQPGPESAHLAKQLGYLTRNLLEQSKGEAAEPLARECLAVHDKFRPEDWTTFYARTLLGGALVGQKKYAEAEKHLLQGYAGMKAREAKIPPVSRIRLPETLKRLVQLYDAWSRPADAAKWRKELEALEVPAKKTTAPRARTHRWVASSPSPTRAIRGCYPQRHHPDARDQDFPGKTNRSLSGTSCSG